MSSKLLIFTTALILSLAALVSSAYALSAPFTQDGKTYYVVSSEDPTENTGDKVCAKVGGQCAGYTLEGSQACQFYHPSAATSSSASGDESGVYCNGPPQTNICATESDTCHTCPECTASVDCSTPIGNLYREMYVECTGGKVTTGTGNSFLENLISQIKNFFANILSKIPGVQQKTTQIITAQIGPYPNMYACDFYQIPFPGVNKKMVSCPYETPGAAANQAADAFCQTAMGSPAARAELCDQNGLIVCVHPCDLPGAIIPNQCAFDNDRPRGNQAPPIKWCDTVIPKDSPLPTGKPANCDDTAYQAHQGYNANQALWDSYAADTDGVCQSQFGKGIPGPCAHTIQLSTGGNPYYLCFYNN